jgi:hypothetical protein
MTSKSKSTEDRARWFMSFGFAASPFQPLTPEALDELMEEVSNNLTAEEMQDMPWGSENLTTIEFLYWYASRKAAGKTIDVKTCEISVWHCHWHDVYGLLDRLNLIPDNYSDCIGKEVFVRAPGSNGWVAIDDLPSTIAKKLKVRMDREREAYRKANPSPQHDPRVAAETLRILEAAGVKVS